jgi:nickel-dependent lactate racemase
MVTKGKTKRGTVIRLNRAVFEHDVVLGCGIIEPSYLCGWSGGRKLLMPGLAHHKSIDNNHYFLTHPDAKIGRLHGNPLSDDAAEFAARLPLHFILYSLSGPNDEVMKVIAGHPVKAHERACAMCERVYRVRAKRADIVISSAGGHPYDCDLVQTKKAIIPAIETVKRNGAVILCGQCPDGLGAEETFVRWLREKTPAEVVRDVRDRRQFSLGAHGANILARPVVEKNAKVILVTGRNVAEQLAGTYVTAFTKLADAWKLANLIAGSQSEVLLIENARRLIVQ